MARFLRTDTNSSGGHSRYRGPQPPIVNQPAPFVARPVQVNQASDLSRRNFRVVARIAKSHLPQVPIVGAGIAFHGPGVRLADPLSPNFLNRRKANSRFTGVVYAPKVYAPIAGYLTEPRDTSPATHSRLQPPAVVTQIVAELARPISTHLAYSKRGKPLSGLGQPKVLLANDAFPQGPMVQYVASARGKAKSRLFPPATLASAAAFVAAPVTVSLAYSTRGKPLSSLPQVTYPGVVYPGIQGIRVRPRDRNPLAHSRLSPPAVVTPVSTEVARPIRVTLTRIRPFPTDASVFKPAVVAQAQGPQGGVGIQLAPSSRGLAKSRLFPPVVAAAVTFVASPIEVRLARSSRGTAKSRLLRVPTAFRPIGFTVKTELAYSKRGTPKSRLNPPTAIDLTPQVFRGKVELAYSVRGKPKSVLRRPTDLVDAQDLGFVKTHLAYSLRGKPKSRLTPPAVVAPVLAKPIVTKLVRIRPAKTIARIEPPTVIDLTPQTKFVSVTFAPSSRGIPKSHLFAPAVVTAVGAPTFSGPKVALTRIRPAHTIVVLRPPTVVAPVLAKPTDVTLAPQKRGMPKSHLSLTAIVDLRPQTYFVSTTLVRIRPPRTIVRLEPPTDLIDRQDLGFVAVTLAPQKRGTPKSVLRLPVVIDLTPQTYYVTVTLAPSFRGKPKPILGKPTDLVDQQDLGFVRAHLAYSLRGIPKSILRVPTVIDLRPQTYYLDLHLAYSLRGQPKSFLRPDSKFAPQPKAETVLAVTLAYSVRGKPKSFLRAPVVVTAATPYLRPVDTTLVRIRPVPTRYILRRPVDLVAAALGSVKTHLAYSLRGKPKSRLIPPTAVFPFFARATDVTLVRILPVPTLHVVRKPVDLVDREDVGFVRVHLAYSLRGKPKSILRPPTVIDLRSQTYFLFTSLAPSRFPVPKSVLRFTTVVDKPQFDSTLLIHLAYPTRGKPKSKLRAPAVVGAGIYFRGIQVELSYSSRRPGKAVLRKPTVVAPVLARAVDVTLVRIRPRRTTAIVRNPVVVRVAATAFPITVTLAPSRLPKPKSVLRKPTVVQAFRIPFVEVHLVRIRPVAVQVLLGKPTDLVDRQDVGFVRVHLAPSRLPKPVSRLSPPTVVFSEFVLKQPVTLVRIVPPAVRSLLKPPTVVVHPENIPTATTFVRIRPVAVHSLLKPPTVVGAGIYFRPILTHLTYSSRGKTMLLLGPMGGVQQCFGTVTGFDFAPSVCGYDEGAVVTGSDSTSHVVTGSDFGATVTGTSAANGTVTGGDTKREGC